MFLKNFVFLSLMVTPSCMLAMDRSSESSKKLSNPSKSPSDSGKKNDSGRLERQASSFFKRMSEGKLSSSKSSSSEKLDLSTLDLEKDHNKIDSCNNTPLICAVQNNDITMVQQLLSYNDITVNHRNKSGNTALHFAAFHGHGSVIELLLEHKEIDTSIKNNNHKMPHQCLNKEMDKFFAVQNKLLKNYLSHVSPYMHGQHFNTEKLGDTNVNDVDLDGISPLIWAVASGQDITIIQKLLSYPRVEVNHQDTIFGTALHYAALFGYSRVINLLLLDYRTNVCIENNYQLKPHACLIEPPCHVIDKKCSCDLCKEYLTIRATLFARGWLYQTIRHHVSQLREQKLDNGSIKKIRKQTIKQISLEKKTQTTEMPEISCLPSYANKEFLEKMIKYCYEGVIVKAHD